VGEKRRGYDIGSAWTLPRMGLGVPNGGHEDNTDRKRMKAIEELTKDDEFVPAEAVMQPRQSQ
jgi:hypothetical protein